MNRVSYLAGAVTLALVAGPASAQQQESQPYPVGNRLGVPVQPTPGREFAELSSNVKVFGGVYAAESCSYDAERGVIVVPNRGVRPDVQVNDSWISFINHDGSVHTARWLGVQSPDQRAGLTPPLVLNEPLGSDVVNGKLYVADRDGGTSESDPSVAVIRWFDMRTGTPVGEVRVAGSPWMNDIAIAGDGTIYATETGEGGSNMDLATWRVWKVSPGGAAKVLVQGAPLGRPNGIALDTSGNVVVVNITHDEVLTFSPSGELLQTEHAGHSGNDGLVILPNGTKYVSGGSGVTRIRPGQPPEVIARNIPSAASMCYDSGANQLVIPLNPNHALAFVRLGGGE